MTDWDLPLDSDIDAPGRASRVFIGLVCLIVRAACLPFDLFARLGQGASDDAGDQGADWGLEVPHDDGCNAA
jgi:hypothetical protein